MRGLKHSPVRHNRRSIRLKEYDYAQAGAYFVTVCCYKKELYFQDYQELKEIVKNQWLQIPNLFNNVILDEYVIMPNHFHGVIFIVPNDNKNIVGAILAVAQPDQITHDDRAGASPAPTRTKQTLGDIIGAFKSLCVKKWLLYIRRNNLDLPGKFWQRNYY